jgi:hypothetical protein
MAAPPRTSLAWTNIAKKLQLRAVIFDARSLQRAANELDSETEKRNKSGLAAAGLGSTSLGIRTPDALVAAGNVKEMLQREIREALKERGADIIGKPWEIQQRLEALLAAEKAEAAVRAALEGGSSGSGDGSAAAPSTPPPSVAKAASSSSADSTSSSSSSSASASSADMLRSKYAAKLRTRAGVSLTAGGVLESTEARRTAPLHRDQRPEQSWHLQPGLRVLFTYLDMRGMARGVIASDESAQDDASARAQAASIVKSLQVPPFSLVMPAADVALARRGERSAIVAACLAMDLLPKQVMFVSDQSPVLQAAKQAGAFSCHMVKRAPGAPDSLPSDFRALDCYGIQDAVEELNGITFRDPDTEIRTQFGVYST